VRRLALPLLAIASFLGAAAGCDLLVPPVRGAIAPNAAPTPPPGAERDCTSSCAARAARCSARECARGCNLTVDRFVEGEGDAVIGCIADGGRCDDRAWARCATRVGPYADGGPPAPPPPPDEFSAEP
jgi:hypothetical protein